MHLNHPKIITSLHVWSMNKLSSMKFIPGAKKFGEVLLDYWGFHGGSDSKQSTCNAEDPGSIPGL